MLRYDNIVTSVVVVMHDSFLIYVLICCHCIAWYLFWFIFWYVIRLFFITLSLLYAATVARYSTQTGLIAERWIRILRAKIAALDHLIFLQVGLTFDQLKFLLMVMGAKRLELPETEGNKTKVLQSSTLVTNKDFFQTISGTMEVVANPWEIQKVLQVIRLDFSSVLLHLKAIGMFRTFSVVLIALWVLFISWISEWSFWL